jgi:predicted phosphodiesterase
VTTTAIISDVHGELARLLRVLADIERRGVSRVVCLGDSVDERAGGAPVLAELMRRGIPSVLGNCDMMCDLDRGSAEEQFVGAMAREMREGDVVFTHISPVSGARGLREVRDAAQVFRGTRQRLCFVGHIHVPAIFAEAAADDRGDAVVVPFEYGVSVELDAGRKYAVCVGAVGRGRDGVEEPRYAVWDDGAESGTQTVEIVRVM